MNKIYYTVYKITNLTNNKIYIGQHKTKNLNDGYMGSGALINRAYKKYGKENFKKEYLFIFDNFKEMNDKEEEIVNEKFVNSQNTYNLVKGGDNGFFNINGRQLNLYGKNKENFLKYCVPAALEKIKELRKNPEWVKMHAKSLSTGLKKYYETHENIFKGKNHTEETKKIIGEKSSINQKGKGNSQYGTVWVSDLSKRISYKVKIDELDKILSSTIIKKRIMDFDKYFEIENIKKEKLKEKNIQKQINKQKLESKYTALFVEFSNGSFSSLRDFCRKTNCDVSHVSLFNNWRKLGLY